MASLPTITIQVNIKPITAEKCKSFIISDSMRVLDAIINEFIKDHISSRKDSVPKSSDLLARQLAGKIIKR